MKGEGKRQKEEGRRPPEKGKLASPSLLLSFFLSFFLLPFSFCLAVPPDSTSFQVCIVPDSSAAAGSFHRFLFGDLWRDVWTLPVGVPVVDASRVADSSGALPTDPVRGGRLYEARDGSRFVFSPFIRPAGERFNEEFRTLYAPGVLADLNAMIHPYGRLLAGPLLDAAGVGRANARLIGLREMAGGDAERSVQGGFAVATPHGQRIHSFDLLRKLERGDAGQVDVPAYLAARILALYLGDWEEGFDAWEWDLRGEGEGTVYQPVLTDPVFAFSRYDGLIPWASTFFLSSVESWGGGPTSVERVLWTGRYLDRWLLSAMGKHLWDSVTAVTIARLADSVIASSVLTLPESVRERIGATLIAEMTARREQLPHMAESFYQSCARVVDVHGTQRSECVEITRFDDERVQVRLSTRTDERAGATTFCDRTFSSPETDEIRVLLKGGDDLVVLRGNTGSSITVRIVCGTGQDAVVDSSLVDGYLFGFVPFIHKAENATIVYRRSGTSITPGAGTSVWEAPPAADNDTLRFAPLREDRGHAFLWTGMFDWNSEFGPMVGFGPTITTFDHDTRPFCTQLFVLGGIAPFAGVGRLVAGVEWRGLIPGAAVRVDAAASGFDVLTYFGRGNETVPARSPGDPFYRVRQTQVRLEPALRWPADGPFTITLRGGFRVVVTEQGGHKYVTEERPYGIADMALASVGGTIRWDTRDDDVHPYRGVYCDVSAAFVPKAFSVGIPYGRLRGDARLFATMGVPLPVTFSLRVLGTRTWGTVPYFDAATIGSSTALRGYEQGRFSGASALVGIAEARVRLGSLDIITPVMVGVFGFAESGRVFEPGEDSRAWHPSFGGGVWAAPWQRNATLTASIGLSNESVMLYGAVGFGF